MSKQQDRADPTDRETPLDLGPDVFRAAGHELVDQIAEFLAGLRDRPVAPGESPERIRVALDAGAPVPRDGVEPGPLLAGTARLLFDHSLFNGHPRFFGYITSSAAPIGMLGDLLAAAVNPNVGGWDLSPMASEIEAQAVRWVAELMDYPVDCGGLFLSGGNMANFTAAAAARVAADPNVRSAGTDGRLRIYGSAETHTWVQKAADLLGLGTDAVRWVETDPQLRINVSALRTALAEDRDAGAVPMMVIGTAGSVSTGAVDPLEEIAEVCAEHDVWFHVDGAYGGFAAVAPAAPEPLRHLALADSVAVDPHKWLYSPLEAGCVLVRDRDALRAAFAYHPPYYHFGQAAISYVDYGPQNSRGFRALKVWLSLRQVGRSGYERMIGDDIALSRRLHAAVEAHPELEAVTQSLSINTFRYVPEELRDGVGTPTGEERLNALNEALLDRIQGSGEAFVSNAVLGGKFVLRACIVNFNTTAADVDALPGVVARIGRETFAG
ncbi:MAG: aminotransferase class V-fold PLP-dependent enzyme [Longimicrobiales bacterium]|nr:aminotransferase class V-fold PLP-dependent enzyme [Longimicrobiales bacterium]